MTKKLIEFDYVDAKGKHSHRIVWPITKPTEDYFSIDLTEYSETERDFIQEQLNDIYAVMLEEIKQLSLDSNYRLFKSKNITNLVEHE